MQYASIANKKKTTLSLHCGHKLVMRQDTLRYELIVSHIINTLTLIDFDS